MLRDLELLWRVIWIGDASGGCAIGWGKLCALGAQHLLNFLSDIFPHSCLIAVRGKKERKKGRVSAPFPSDFETQDGF